MSEKEIIQKWKSGYSVLQISKDYMEDCNFNAHIRKEPKITQLEAQKIVEKTIFDFQTKF